MSEAGPKTIRAAFRGMVGQFQLDAAFTVPATGITALFGPSACGKTTVLRCLAGLHRLSDGFCAIDGDVWQDRTSFRRAYERPIGYVFQEASLFPHLSVKRNLLYGAPRGGPMAGSRVIAFDEVLDLLGLEKLLDRSPQNLSGGERQRVAIGRALLSQPKLLLMDEPLSALDRLTKDEILPFLERLHERLSLPVIYISHDMTELERLADHLILMRAGAVIAVGPLNALQSDPSLPLAIARDAAVSFNGTTIAYDANFGILTLQIDGGQLFVPSSPTPTGERRRVRIAAGDVSLSLDRPKTSSILNVLPARIVSNAPVGQNEIIVVLALTPTLPAGEGGARLLARITRRSWEQLGLREGMPIFAQVKGVSLALK